MSARHDLSRFCGCTALMLLTLTRPVAAGCTPDWIEKPAGDWCFAYGGTFDADVRQAGAGDEIIRVNRQADGPLFARDNHGLGVALAYDNFELDETVAANLDLYRIELRYRLHLGDTATLHIAPALATSSNRIFEDMQRDDVLLQAAFTHHWQQPDMVAGIVADPRLGGGLRIYPIVSVPFALDNGSYGAVGFPDAYLTREGQAWDWTLRLGPGGYSWHVLDDDANSRFDVNSRRWELSVSAVRRHRPRLFVNAGVAFAREIHFTTSTARRVETRLDPALFAAVGLRLGSLDANSKTQRK